MWTLRYHCVIVLLAVSLLMGTAEGNGMICDPVGRPEVASKDTKRRSLKNLPTEQCPFCVKEAGRNKVCGKSQSVDYTLWRKSRNGRSGPRVAVNPGKLSVKGNVIEVTSLLLPNRGGFIEVSLCPRTWNPTPNCFERFPLEFVKDLTANAVPHDDYKTRAYVPTDGGE